VATSPSLPEEVRARFLTKFANRITTEGDLVITSEKSRDQPSNIEDCYDKLREMILSVATTPRKRKPTKPTKGSQKRRLDEKKGRAQTKQMRGKVKREE
jgi:ribosome-associated protein